MEVQITLNCTLTENEKKKWRSFNTGGLLIEVQITLRCTSTENESPLIDYRCMVNTGSLYAGLAVLCMWYD